MKVRRVETYEWEDKSRWDWYVEEKWYLDPCSIEDEKELEKEIEGWKKEVIEQYKDLVEKYGESSADSLFSLISIERSDCYEWEINIE